MSSGPQLSHAGGSQNSHPSAEGELLEIKIYTHIRMKHFQFLLCFLCLKLLAKEQANHLWIRKKFSFFITAETLSQVWEQGQCKSLKRLVYCGHEIPLCWESPSFDPSPCWEVAHKSTEELTLTLTRSMATEEKAVILWEARSSRTMMLKQKRRKCRQRKMRRRTTRSIISYVQGRREHRVRSARTRLAMALPSPHSRWPSFHGQQLYWTERSNTQGLPECHLENISQQPRDGGQMLQAFKTAFKESLGNA